jgi:DNA-binding Lrp family transcriptional regulator
MADLRVLRAMENGIEVVPRPFDTAGEKIGMTGTEVRGNLKEMLNDGTIRSFGAVVDHRSLGLVVNAMVVWDVDDAMVERAGMDFSEMPMVSHCYERKRAPGKWSYNLFTMVHGSSEVDLVSFLEQGKEITSDADFQVLRSLKEFKKVGVRF